ncbi:unnamed protein product [Rotaria sp. Silwood1]|nr:unnamed protein product [Rotaria sp. Silwood1]
MAEPSETSSGSIKNNSSLITTIQPTTKLGGRGTPRRKTRRPNTNNHSAVVAARALENKLKSFRTQFQLFDQQELCDVSILYEDGHIDIQQQVQVHSTWPMTLHEIDSSETSIQTYHINDLDLTSCSYLLGNLETLQHEFYRQSIPSTTTTTTAAAVPLITTPIPTPSAVSISNYVNNLQQCQFYSQPSHNYMNYVGYQHNPYAANAYESFSNDIRQIYGNINKKSDEEKDEQNPTITKSKRRRRRHKHSKIKPEQSSLVTPEGDEMVIDKPVEQSSLVISNEDEMVIDKPVEQSSSVIPQEDEMVIDKPAEHLENENITTKQTKSKRRRIRKSKKSLTLSSITGAQELTSVIIEQPETNSSYLINEKINEDTLSSSTPTQQTEQHSSSIELMKQQPLTSMKSVMHGNKNLSTKHVANVLQSGEKKKKEKEKKELQPANTSTRTTNIIVDDVTPTVPTHTSTTSTNIVDINKTDDKHKNITLPTVDNTPIINTSKNQSPPVIIITDDDNKKLDKNISIKRKKRKKTNVNDQQQIISLNSQQQSLSDHTPKAITIHTLDNSNTSFSNKNLNMSDKNGDSSSISREKSSKSSDAQTIVQPSFDKGQKKSLEDNSKSTITTDSSQHLPATLNKISVGEILLTDKHEEQHRHAILPSSSSKTNHVTENLTTTNKEQSKLNLGETIRNSTHLLQTDNDNIKPTKHLNPDAPDFKPTHLTSTYRSELAPMHLQRHAIHADPQKNRHSRIRYYSDTYQLPESLITSTNTSTIRPLLSVVPQYIPQYRQSFSALTPLLSSTNSWWPQEYSHTLCSASSYCPKPAYQLYTPLMPKQQQQQQQQQLQPLQQHLTDENQSLHHQQKNKYPSKRIRTYSGRPFVQHIQIETGRIRSYSGPETSLQSSSAHLDGIHSLTRIMVDILRGINSKKSEEQKHKHEIISSLNLNSYSLAMNKYQQPSYQYITQSLQQEEQHQKSSEAKNDLANENKSTKAPPLLPLSVDKAAVLSDENEILSTNLNDDQQKQIYPLISNDTNEKTTINTDSTFSISNKQFYDTPKEEESIKSMSNIVPEASIENEEKEKSGNRGQHMAKIVEDEERDKQHQPNSTFSSSSSASEPSKYFES